MSLARDVTTVGTATLFSRLLGFFRDVGIAAVLGAGVLSDAYFAALQIPNLFRRLLAEGALNSAFVPMWLRIREERGVEGTRRFGERTLGTMLVALGIIAVICVVFAPEVVRVLAPGFQTDGERFALAVDFVRLSIPYIAIAGPVAVAASVLNAEGRVFRRRRPFGRGRAGRPRPAHPRRRRPDDAPGRPAAPDLGARHPGGPPFLRAGDPGRGGRRHPAVEADGRRDGCLLVAGRGVVALLRQQALRAAAWRGVDRDRLGDRAGDCRQRARQ